MATTFTSTAPTAKLFTFVLLAGLAVGWCRCIPPGCWRVTTDCEDWRGDAGPQPGLRHRNRRLLYRSRTGHRAPTPVRQLSHGVGRLSRPLSSQLSSLCVGHKAQRLEAYDKDNSIRDNKKANFVSIISELFLFLSF